MLPRTISPLCRHLAARAHCVSLIVWPTRSWSTSVGRLLGRIWPRTTSSGSSGVGWLARGGLDRDHQEEIREGEVGQDAPAPEQALQVAELFGLELRVGLRQLGRSGHASRAFVGSGCGRFPTATGVRRPAPVALEGTDADRVEQVAQAIGPVGDLLLAVRVRGRRERHPAGDETLEERRAPGTAPRPACAIPPRRPRPPCPTWPPPPPCGPTTRPARRGRDPPP